jgi:hypothetical protein
LRVNKPICEAVGCEKEATEELAVSAGTFGVLVLSVCNTCISKFTQQGGE